MNQELSATISQIDGIRSAKVLVTAPPRERFDAEAPRATASVAIHYERTRDIRPELSSIKMIVAHALPNLRYDDVAVALFPVGGPSVAVADGASGPAPGERIPTTAMAMLPQAEGLLSQLDARLAGLNLVFLGVWAMLYAAYMTLSGRGRKP